MSAGNKRVSTAVSPGPRSNVGNPDGHAIDGSSEPEDSPVGSGNIRTNRGHRAPLTSWICDLVEFRSKADTSRSISPRPFDIGREDTVTESVGGGSLNPESFSVGTSDEQAIKEKVTRAITV
jgi:hypothetical protein